MPKLDVKFDLNSDSALIPVRVVVKDTDLLGRSAVFKLIAKAHVKDSRPVHGSSTLYEHPLQLEYAEIEFSVPRDKLRGYSYKGAHIDLHIVTRITVDDGILFDTSEDDHHTLPIGDRPAIANDSAAMMEPSDAFSFIANLNAIPPKNRLITLWLAAVGLVVIGFNTLLGVHDQFVPESQTYFYDHRGDDGSESPLMKSLVGSGATGLSIWLAIRAQLRKYMRIALKKNEAPRRGMRISAADLIEGESRVPLEQITVRVVACNRECGQYKRGSGTKERTVSFRKTTRAVKLYEKFLAHVPAHVPLQTYLDGEIDFEPMFASLYPPLMVTGSHGVEVAWEVQLLHPKFVDQELPGPNKDLAYEDFLDA